MRQIWEGFIKAILEAPEDDGPRLIFADWLDETEDFARAEFIRIQIALSKISAHDRRRLELQLAQDRLRDRHLDEWTAPLRGLTTGWEFHRGFVQSAKITARQFIHNASELFAIAPINELHFLDVGSNLSLLLSSNWLQKLSGITIYAQHLRADLARAIAESKFLLQLKRLNIARNEICNDGVSALAMSSLMPQLEELNLGENGINDLGVRALTSSGRMDKLRHLELGSNAIRSHGLGLILSSGRLPRLTRLGLSNNDIGDTFTPPPAMDYLQRLKSLDLSGNGLNVEHLRAIFTSSDGYWISELDLSNNLLGDLGAAFIARSNAFMNLQTLKLTNNQIGDNGLAALAESPILSRLATLELGNNPVGNNGVRSLLESRRLMNLRHFVCPVIGLSMPTRTALLTRYPGFR